MSEYGSVRRIWVFLAGCLLTLPGLWFTRSHTATHPRPEVVMEVLDPSLEPYAPLWKREIARRFPNAVGILVHGGDFVEGSWVVGSSLTPWKHVTPVAEIVTHYKTLHPDKTVVLLACNGGHLKLGIPGVYYSPDLVWSLPDREYKPGMLGAMETLGSDFEFSFPIREDKTRWELMPDVVGNVWEFVCEP